MTIGLFASLAIIFLMIFLGRPEFPGGGNLGCHIIALDLEQTDKFQRNLFLLIVLEIDRGAILVADIRPLAVNLGRVVDFKKQPCEFFERGFGRIVNDLDSFGMASLS